MRAFARSGVRTWAHAQGARPPRRALASVPEPGRARARPPERELGRTDRRRARRRRRPPVGAAAPRRRRAADPPRRAANGTSAACASCPAMPGTPDAARMVRPRPPLAARSSTSSEGEIAVYVARGALEVDLDGDDPRARRGRRAALRRLDPASPAPRRRDDHPRADRHRGVIVSRRAPRPIPPAHAREAPCRASPSCAHPRLLRPERQVRRRVAAGEQRLRRARRARPSPRPSARGRSSRARSRSAPARRASARRRRRARSPDRPSPRASASSVSRSRTPGTKMQSAPASRYAAPRSSAATTRSSRGITSVS